jgi:hypothetical protein
MTMFIPATGVAEAAAMADAGHAAHAHDRHVNAENLAELRAIDDHRFRLIGRLLAKLRRRS